MEKCIVSKAIGIDLGTTNSVVALMNMTDTDITIYRYINTKGEPVKSETTPSCVWKDPKTKQIVVGPRAFSQLGNTPRPIRSIKRMMGKQDTVLLTDEQATPEQISAYILGEMKLQADFGLARQATPTTHWLIDRAIVTIPAYFDQPQIEATRKAAELAGLTVLELLHEPVAAACYHCWETNTRNGVFLVYDFGGGTFDVSILRCTEGEFEVLGISGNKELGGNDIDKLLAEELRVYLQNEGYQLDLDADDEEDQLRFDKLKMLAEGVKKALTDKEEYVLRDTATLQDQNGERVNIDRVFERHELETLMRPVIERTLPYCFLALDQAEKKTGITLADVDTILLAGGSTHIPLVREMVQQTFCATTDTHELRAKCTEPIYKRVDTIVGLGAAIRAAATGGLAIYNEVQTVRVFFRGTGTTEAKQTHLSGEVTSLIPSINLNGGQVRLLMPEQGYEDEQDLKANGSFSFTRIPLQATSDNTLVIEVYDCDGARVASVNRIIRQSKDAVQPTGGSTGTAMLSKAFILDVVNENEQPNKEILFKELTTLAAKKDFTFYYRGGGFVRFPFYQKAKKIYEVQVEVPPEVEEGTPILIVAEVDTLANLKFTGTIGDVQFEAKIMPPPERNLPSTEVVQEFEQTFRKAVVSLPINKQSVVKSRYQHAKRSYDAAIARRDSSQAMSDFEEMEEIIGDLRPSNHALYPPIQELDALVQKCLDLNEAISYEQQQLESPYNYRQVIDAIVEQRTQGEIAFEEYDQTGYDIALQNLKSLWSHLNDLRQQILQKTDARTETEKTGAAIGSLLQDVETLYHVARKQGKSNEQKQLEDIRQRLYEAQRVDVQIARRTIYQCYIDMEQVRNILQNSPQQSIIEGLVEKRDQ